MSNGMERLANAADRVKRIFGDLGLENMSLLKGPIPAIIDEKTPIGDAARKVLELFPAFHEGGKFRAPTGRNEGLANLLDGEIVLPAGTSTSSGGNIYITVQGSLIHEDDLWEIVSEHGGQVQRRNAGALL
jgi:hypothetical protein